MFAERLTEQLALRDLAVSDAQRIFEYPSRPDVSRFPSGGTQSADAIQSSIRDLSETEPRRPRSWYQTGIIPLSTRELIGESSLQVREAEPRHAELRVRCGQ